MTPRSKSIASHQGLDTRQPSTQITAIRRAGELEAVGEDAALYVLPRHNELRSFASSSTYIAQDILKNAALVLDYGDLTTPIGHTTSQDTIRVISVLLRLS